MGRTLVFAGAGASKAVNASAYPTTIEFFERLPSSVTGDQLFGLMTKFLRRGKAPNAPLDIEQVLWSIQELQTFLEAVTSSSSLPGWFLEDSRLLLPLSLTTNFNNLTENGKKILELTRNLRNEIDKQVYDLYGQLAREDELENNWLYLLNSLLTRGARVDVFTTNYDRNIEVALRYLPRKFSEAIDTGRRDNVDRFMDETSWTDAEASAPGLLTKLHGSVDWSWDREQTRVIVSDPLFKGDHGRHVILYPGFKGVPDRRPFNFFHSYFARALADADHIIFIGFAFRDDYINEMLQRYANVRATIISLNIVQAQAPFGARAIHVESSFGREGVDDVLAKLP